MKKLNKKSKIAISFLCIIAVALPIIGFNFSVENYSEKASNTTTLSNDTSPLLSVVSSSTNDVNNKDTLNGINDKHILNMSVFADTEYDFSSNKTLSELSDYIAIVRIDSIEGVTNINRKTNKPVLAPYSYGKATVLNVVKGEFSTNEISFVRNGGLMPYDEWIEGTRNPEKLRALKEESELLDVPEEEILVNYSFENDIEIEEGKAYLVFMCRDESFNFENEYIIQGFQYGLRELQQTNVSSYSVQNTASLKVKNNMTGKWESLTDVVYLDETEFS